jgi:hypothetical protein
VADPCEQLDWVAGVVGVPIRDIGEIEASHTRDIGEIEGINGRDIGEI